MYTGIKDLILLPNYRSSIRIKRIKTEMSKKKVANEKEMAQVYKIKI